MKPRTNPRWNHVYALWRKATHEQDLPQFDRWLAEEFKKHSNFGSRDRKWYSEVLFACVRFGGFAAFAHLFYRKGLDAGKIDKSAFESFVAEFENMFDSPRAGFEFVKAMPVEDAVFWAMRKLYSQSTPEQQSELEPFEPFANAGDAFLQLAQLLQKSTDVRAQMIWSGVPLWYHSFLKRRALESGWDANATAQFLKLQCTRPPLWLRLNHLSRAEEAKAEMLAEGFEVSQDDSALKVTGPKGIFNMKGYREGVFEIQDLASQQIGASLKAKPGQIVWDSCAGGGGKTIQIASALQNKGAVYASDIREYKLEEVKKRARRAGFFNVRCVPWQGEQVPAFPKEVQLRSGFDWVLVDAPCSSTGTWRRNPDAKYRIEQKNIENLFAVQLKLLTTASLAVKPGGSIVYSTCSWLVEENEDVVAKFLETRPEFKLTHKHLAGAPGQDSDTMFAATLTRN